MSQIPIVINNFNRLSTLEKLVDQLLLLDYTNITVLDMSSTYPPLLQYYKQNKSIKVVTIPNKYGQKAFWKQGVISKFSQPWIAYTDSDIELNIDTPKGFIEDMIVAAHDFRIGKVGLALGIDNIQNDFLKSIIYPIERKYWDTKLPYKKYPAYFAPVDSTFCVVRTSDPFSYNAIRLGGIMTCIHVPWNTDWSNLTEEEKYYIETADPNIATYVGHYNNWLKLQNA